MAIKGIGFDIDGTLYNDKYMFMGTLPTFFKYPSLAFNFAMVRSTIRNVRPIEDFKATQAKMLADRMNILKEKAEYKIEKNLFKEWENKFKIIKPFSGLKECVIKLKKDGYKLGVLSDFPLQNKLEYLRLTDWDCAFTAEEVNYLKPNPEPFLELAERLNLLPENILYVGNSYKKDILGASMVGMKTAHFSRLKRKKTVADITFNSYHKLFSLIKEIDDKNIL